MCFIPWCSFWTEIHLLGVVFSSSYLQHGLFSRITILFVWFRSILITAAPGYHLPVWISFPHRKSNVLYPPFPSFRLAGVIGDEWWGVPSPRFVPLRRSHPSSCPGNDNDILWSSSLIQSIASRRAGAAISNSSHHKPSHHRNAPFLPHSASLSIYHWYHD